MLGLCLFSVGFAGSYWWLRTQPDSPQAAENVPLAVEIKAPPAPETPEAFAAAALADLKRADTFFEQGRWDLALASYEQMSGEKKPRVPVVGLKIGVSLEGLGLWEKALAVYRWVASHGDKELADASLLGQARVLIRLGQAGEAKKLLCSFLLRSAGAAPDSLADGRYLFALALGHEALPRAGGQPLETGVVRPPLPAWQPRKKEQAATTASATKATVPKLVIFEQGGVPPEQRLVTATLTQTPVKEVLDELAKLGGLQVNWAPSAVPIVTGRSTQLDLVNFPLIDVVTAVAEPLKLLCTVKEKTLHIAASDDVDKEALTAYRLASARRALQYAVRAHPGHAWTPAALLELAGLAEALGKSSRARTLCEQLLQDRPRSSLVIAASYNLGTLYERQEQRALAVRNYYRVVDHAPGHELATLALLHIGRIHLNQGEFRQALTPLRRAVAGAGAEVLPTAAITLAAAYLAVDKTADANALLLRQRGRLGDKAYRPAAAFLDAYARFRMAVARKETRREPADLVAALLAVRKDTILGLFGKYLAGKAFRDLGMWDEVVRTYDKLAEKRASGPAPNPLFREITFYLAEAQYMLKKPDRAVPVLTSLADRHQDTWAARARFQLAAIALQEDRPGDCVQACLRICQEHLPVEREHLLHLMGEAYERLGEHEKAARCFAGQMPQG